MIIKDLDGINHNWHLTGHIARNRTSNKSDLHLLARKIIISVFPTLQILEEVSVPIRKTEYLYLDFYIPLKKLCIEVHGEQHYKFVPFYHNNLLSFAKAQKRDREKTEWCEINGIKQIILPYNENQKEWESRIVND